MNKYRFIDTWFCIQLYLQILYLIVICNLHESFDPRQFSLFVSYGICYQRCLWRLQISGLYPGQTRLFIGLVGYIISWFPYPKFWGRGNRLKGFSLMRDLEHIFTKQKDILSTVMFSQRCTGSGHAHSPSILISIYTICAEYKIFSCHQICGSTKNKNQWQIQQESLHQPMGHADFSTYSAWPEQN